MYCLWPLPHLLLVCTTLVCVLFVALPCLLLVCTTTTYTIGVYYSSMCVYPCSITICCISVYTIIIWLLQCTHRGDYFSMCVYPCSITICCISVYTIIIWLLQRTRRGEESPWMTASHWRQKQIFLPNKFFSAPFIYSRIYISMNLTTNIEFFQSFGPPKMQFPNTPQNSSDLCFFVGGGGWGGGGGKHILVMYIYSPNK